MDKLTPFDTPVEYSTGMRFADMTAPRTTKNRNTASPAASENRNG